MKPIGYVLRWSYGRYSMSAHAALSGKFPGCGFMPSAAPGGLLNMVVGDWKPATKQNFFAPEIGVGGYSAGAG